MKKDIKIGEFQKFKHPEYAERHNLNDFIKRIKGTKFSEVLEKEVRDIIEIFNCPKCGKKADYKQEHGDAYKCGKCGLNRQSFGLSLYVWDDGIIPEQTNETISEETNETIFELKEMLQREVSNALNEENYELIVELKKIFDRALENKT